MSIVEKIKNDLLIFRKQKDSEAVTIISTLLAEVVSIGKNSGGETSDAQAIKRVQKFIEGAEEIIKTLNIKGSTDGLSKAEREISLLQTYLPAQMSLEDLGKHVGIIVQQVTSEIQNPKQRMGEVIKRFRAQFDGQYDPRQLSGVVNKELSKV